MTKDIPHSSAGNARQTLAKEIAAERERLADRITPSVWRLMDQAIVLLNEPQPPSKTRPAAFLAWAADVFGDVALDRKERAMRFLEEALEVVHAEGIEHLIADRIMGRVWKKAPNPAETPREIGQAYACLETYAESIGVSADAEANTEFERVKTFSKDVLCERHQAKVVLGIALNPSSSMTRPQR